LFINTGKCNIVAANIALQAKTNTPAFKAMAKTRLAFFQKNLYN
jgi:hypothetical protein